MKIRTTNNYIVESSSLFGSIYSAALSGPVANLTETRTEIVDEVKTAFSKHEAEIRKPERLV